MRDDATGTLTTAGRPGDGGEHDQDGARAAAGPGHRRGGGTDPLFQVRTSDVEPYTGLGYLSKLFRFIAVILLLLLGAEIVTGISTEGTESISTLIAEGSRLLVLAGLLWGVGDLATLLIDVGHDVRAARILLGRQASQLHHLAEERVGDIGERRVPLPSPGLGDGQPAAAATRGDGI